MKLRLLTGSVLAMLLVSIPPPAQAANSTEVAHGSVMLYGWPIEVASYTQGGCAQDSLDGVFTALVDVRKYSGKTLLVKMGATDHNEVNSALPVSPSFVIDVYEYTDCTVDAGIGYVRFAPAAPGHPAKITATGLRFLAIQLSGPLTVVEGQHFSISVCLVAAASCS
jgi:hypothetical protein